MQCKILITGDFCPFKRIDAFLQKEEYGKIFNDFLKYSQEADIAITNLECPLTNNTIAIPKSGPPIKGNPEGLKALKFAGFHVATLANNHVLDYGFKGLQETVEHCKKEGIKHVGAGLNIDEARQPLYLECKDKKIGIYNVAENEFGNTYGDEAGANPLNPIRNFHDIRQAKSNVDFLIVIAHGGREHYQLPSPRVKELYRFFVDAGADAVVAHHTHCISGYEVYKKAPIFYSLGNFVFDYKKKYQKGLWVQGMAVQLLLGEGKLSFELIPFWQGRVEDPTIRLLDKEERVTFDKLIEDLSKIIADDNLLKSYWEDYLKTQQTGYKGLLYLQNKYLRELMRRKMLPEVYLHSKEHSLVLLNLLRCETHREIMIDTLSKEFQA